MSQYLTIDVCAPCQNHAGGFRFSNSRTTPSAYSVGVIVSISNQISYITDRQPLNIRLTRRAIDVFVKFYCNGLID